MSEVLVALLGAVVTVLTVAGSWFVARRYQRLGGGEAQTKLNVVYKELTSAFEEKNKVLSDRLHSTETELSELRAEVARIRTERRDLKQEIADLHEALRLARVEVEKLTEQIAALREELSVAHAQTAEANRRADAGPGQTVDVPPPPRRGKQ